MAYVCRTAGVRDGNKIIAKGKTAWDIAQEAIGATWDPKNEVDRRWHLDKCPSLIVHLKGVAKSMISNARTAKETLTTGPYPVNKDGDVNLDLLEEQRVDKEKESPLEDFIESANAEEMADEIMEALAEEPELEKVCDLIMAGKKPQEIAAEMGLDQKAIYNLNRQLKRKLRERLQRFSIKGGDKH